MELRPQSEIQHGVVGRSLKTSQNVNELSLTDGFWTLSVSGGIVRSSLRATGDTGKAREWNKTSASCRQYFQRHKGIRGLHNQKFTMSECMLLKSFFCFVFEDVSFSNVRLLWSKWTELFVKKRKQRRTTCKMGFSETISPSGWILAGYVFGHCTVLHSWT